jgi:AraC-like DNA-binding protein
MTSPVITYREFKPDYRLQEYIKSYWSFKIQTNNFVPFDILPDGYFDLIITLKNNRIVNTSLTGIWSKSVSIIYKENTDILGIRFKPLAIGTLLSFNIKELLNTAAQVNIKDFGLNSQFLLDGFNGFQQTLINNLDKHYLSILYSRTIDKRLKYCFDIADSSIGTQSVGTISNVVGMSTRQLHRTITGMIGVGLKDYLKIVRFRDTMRRVKCNKSDYSPYFDQSHFIRDVKEFTGSTPDKMDLNKDVRFIQYFDFENR